MIKLTGRLVCKSAEEADLVRQYLPEHKQLTRKETGCVSFEVTETADPWSGPSKSFYKPGYF